LWNFYGVIMKFFSNLLIFFLIMLLFLYDYANYLWGNFMKKQRILKYSPVGFIISILFLSCVSFSSQGDAAFAAGDYDKAIEAYNNAVDRDPNNADLYYHRGLAYQEKGNYDRAIADFSQAIRLNPTLDEAYAARNKATQSKGSQAPGAPSQIPGPSTSDLSTSNTDQMSTSKDAAGAGGTNQSQDDQKNPADRNLTQAQPVGSPVSASSSSPRVTAPPADAPLGTRENPYDWTTTEKQLENADIPYGSWVLTQNVAEQRPARAPRQAQDNEIDWAKKRAAQMAGKNQQ